jgi:CheY-like chemotaxis protein
MPARKATLLCVDDDSQCLEIRRLLFEAFGFSVVTCTDPRQGLRLHRKKHFDAAILDYQMPFMNGAELAKEMKAVRAEVPILILSGLDRLPADAPPFYDRFLCKTESAHKIASEVQSLIGPPNGDGGRPVKVPLRRRFLAFSALALGFAVEAITRKRTQAQKHDHPAIDLKSLAARA